MHRIDTAGSASGQFQDGNPTTGTRGTRVGADWLNDLQANCFAILEEGGVSPTKGRAEDLLDAIVAIATGAAGSGGGSVPTTRQLTAQGLVQGGGSLAADRAFNVPAASAAEVAAGTSTSAAITPKALADSLAAGLSGGRFRFGPLTILTGYHTAYMFGGSYFITFSTPFDNACLGVIPVALNNTGSGARDTWAQLVAGPSETGFTVIIQGSGGGGDGTVDGIHYIAIGH